MGLNSFEDLKCWQACHELRGWVKILVRSWPSKENFDLTDQVKRSSRSACANLAEGYGRNNSKDNARFCKNSLGSLWETLDHLIDARQSQYINEEEFTKGRELIEKAIKLTRGYMRYLYGNSELREPSVPYGNEIVQTTDNKQQTT
jgi:four helix bundle protein